MPGNYTSKDLTIGDVYTRRELAAKYGISDATLNTGIFRPKGYDSVWLFVTEHKTPDRTQYIDQLKGDRLVWQGQTSGRKDSLIREHSLAGLELLLFYRRRKTEFLHAGFRYEGRFCYESSRGTLPTTFVLTRETG